MFKKKSESGRSMVEMLGVLAIIGVLSIGGIAGYTLSMRRHRANQLLDVVNKYALVAYGACQKSVLDNKIIGLTSCFIEYVPSFNEANLGTNADLAGLGSLKIRQINGVEQLTLAVGFKDEAICKAAQSICGKQCTNDCKTNLYLLDSDTNRGYSIYIPFKFN